MVKLEKNSIHRATIEGYSAEGLGIARLDGLVVFVQGALRGEVCDLRIVRPLKNMAYAIIERLIEPSPERRVPDCPHDRRCGGCDFRHMSYAEELRAKLMRVNDALRRLGGLSLQLETVHGSGRIEGYRNKAQYFVGPDGGVGFYRARSHELCPIDRCAIQDPRSDACAAALRDWLAERAVPPYNEAAHEGLVRGLQTRCGDGGLLATVIVNGEALPDEDGLCARLRAACPALCGVVLNSNTERGNTLLGDRNRVLWGEGVLRDRLCGLTFEISSNSFYQINKPQAERLYRQAAAYAAPEGKLLLDLYCGTGTIGLTMADRARAVIGAELVPEAVRDAERNATANGIANARFLCADAGEAAAQLAAEGLRPDVVVVDPPRKGLSPEVINHIRAMAPARVVYVSCDPATLARDLKLFCADDAYAVTAGAAFDLFPRCAHVETVTLLEERPKK